MRLFYTLIIMLFLTTNVNCQYKSIGINLYSSYFLDGAKDIDYDYESVGGDNLKQISLEYSSQVNKNVCIDFSLGYSKADVYYQNYQTLNTTTLEDRTFVEKHNEIFYFRIGAGATYWFKKVGKGPFAKTELIFNKILSATSYDEIKLDQDEPQFFEVDLTERMRNIMPLIKIGVGYNLILKKRYNVSLAIYADLRKSTYFKDEDNFRFINRGMELSLKYTLSETSED